MVLDYWIVLIQIMMVNIVLSGDNAVVIALAARNLPPKLQRIAILWGCGGAMVLRILLTVVAIEILKISFLPIIGALLLMWIAVRLLIENSGSDDSHPTHDSLFGAVKTIVIADVIMSLDNTLAIAGVAKGNTVLMIIGLAFSIPLIVFGSTIIVKLMDSFPVIVYIGAGLIAWTSGSMIDDDRALQSYLPNVFRGSPYLAILLTTAVIGYGWWYNRKKGRTAQDILTADKSTAQKIENRIDDV